MKKRWNGDAMSGVYSPFVSVIIPTYNRADLLSKAIQSVLEQTYQNFEIVIIDDNSSDDTGEVVHRYNDERIKYIRLNKNQGAPAARNIGLEKAKGELIAFLDSDDQWLAAKLEKQIEFFKREENVGLIYTGRKIITKELERTVLPQKRGDMRNSLLIKNYIGTTSSVLIKKELIDQVGGFDLTFKSCQDWDLFIRLSQTCKFEFVEEPLVLYFEHSGERISTNSKSVLHGHLAIRKKHSSLIKKLTHKEIWHHYLNLGKIMIKAGILLLDRNLIDKTRLLLFKFPKLK